MVHSPFLQERSRCRCQPRPVGNLAGTSYLHTLVPQRVGLGEGLGPRYNIHENATWFAEGNVNVEMRTSGAITWIITFTGFLQ